MITEAFTQDEQEWLVTNADWLRAVREGSCPQQSDVWQPIETAPKDGTEVLIYERFVAQFDPETRHCEHTDVARFEDGQWRGNNDEPPPPTPSHWMPLPQPPEQPRRG